MNQSSQPTQGNQIEALSLDKMREAIAAVADLSSPLHPTENVYVNEHGWQRILTEISGFYLGPSMDQGRYMGYKIISDSDVPHNQFIMCSSEDWRYYKQLCRHPYIKVWDLTDKQINYLISVLKEPPVDTLSYLHFVYTPPIRHIEIDGFHFGI